jgi:nucleolar protein 16
MRRSYAALGLMHDLNPSSSGGTEIDPHALPTSADVALAPLPHAETHSSGIKKGFGRIIRDDLGNIVDVEMAEDDANESASVDEAVDPDEEWEGIGSASEWVQTLSARENATETEVVRGACARYMPKGLPRR